jgi:hypothetical protein
MTKLTKAIEKATVFFKGDRSVGIPDCSFDVELHYDPTCFESQYHDENLETIRLKLIETYEMIQGETPDFVMFDFEMKAEHDAEKAFDAEYEKYCKELDEMGPRSQLVKCQPCNKEFKSEEVKFLDVFSDVQERDNMVFICPACNTKQSSVVYL